MTTRSTSLKLTAAAAVTATALTGGVTWAAASDTDGNAGGATTSGRTPISATRGPVSTLSAQVSSTANLVRGRGAKKVLDAGTGTYRVRFVRKVESCVFTGSLTDQSTGFGTVGYISLATDGAHPRGVYVETRDTAANLVDSDFSLIVVC